MAGHQVADQRVAHRQPQARAHVHEGVGQAVLVALEMRLDVAARQRVQRPFGDAQQDARGQQQAIAVHGRGQKGHGAPQQQADHQASAHAEERRAKRRQHEGRNAVAHHEGRGQKALARAVVVRQPDVVQKSLVEDEDRKVDPVHIGDGDDDEEADHPPPAGRTHIFHGKSLSPDGLYQKKWRTPTSKPEERPPSVVPGADRPCTPMDLAAPSLFLRKATVP